MSGLAPTFKRFMFAVYNCVKEHHVDDFKVAKYLFDNLKDAYSDSKYGFDYKSGCANFHRMMRLCILLKDYDFVREIWQNMVRDEKDRWWEGAVRIPDLETFFAGDCFLHNYFHIQNLKPVCCDYCLFLKEINYISCNEIDQFI